MNTEKLFKELKTFCKSKGLEEREAAYLLGLFTKHNAALRQPHVVGQSEQLKAFCQYCETRQIQPKRFKWDEIIKDYESL